jgi:hypothetical protein
MRPRFGEFTRPLNPESTPPPHRHFCKAITELFSLNYDFFI